MTVLRFPYDDKFGGTHGSAIGVIRDARVELAAGHAEVAVNVYVSQQAIAAGAAPIVERPPRALTEAEIATLRSQFEDALYNIVRQWPEFRGAQLVS